MFPSRGGPLRLVKSLRGDGTLMWGRQANRPVSYSIDVYAQGTLMSGDGDVRGELVDLVGKTPVNLRLRLADGEEVRIMFRDISADVASIELLDPAPAHAESAVRRR
jgi:hypothetical protein